MESGFVKAQSDNLPKVDAFMVDEFYKNNINYSSAEIRGNKINRSARETYGDDAIGYVQVKRIGDICIVKAKITPEHKVRNKSYSCDFECNEKNKEIIRIECKDCAAQKGGCKHGVAFMMWLHRRSEEPSLTEKKCYWAKPKLSKVGTTLKFIKAKDIGARPSETSSTSSSSGDQGSFLIGITKVLKEVPGCQKIQLMRYFVDDSKIELSLHCLYNKFKVDTQNSCDHFLRYCADKMTPEKCVSVEKRTSEQSDSPLWFELRYCRITASKAYEAAQCKTEDGALVEQIFGAKKIKDTLAMKRGKTLEDEVREKVAKIRNLRIKKSGFFLKSEWPVLGASPDGITEKYVIEIKCPTTEKAEESYVKNGVLSNKSKAQIQLQMYFADKVRGLFCVANPKFEKNKMISIYEVEYDDKYCLSIMCKCTEFWKKAIFEKLQKTYQ